MTSRADPGSFRGPYADGPPPEALLVDPPPLDAFCRLGPMFIKLGQLLGSSPSICPAVLSEAARRCIREVNPLDVAAVRAVIEADLGRPADELFATFED